MKVIFFVVVFGGAGDGTQGLMHARPATLPPSSTPAHENEEYFSEFGKILA
jgi:hypothetical protein